MALERVLDQVSVTLTADMYQLAEQNAGLGTWSFACGPETLRLSDNLYNILGIDPGQVTAPDYFLSHVHPGDRERAAEALDPIFRGETADEFQCRILHPLKGERTIKMFPPRRHETGGYIIGTIQDITDQKKAEGAIVRQQSLLRSAERIARTGSWERNLKTGELEWSDELFRIYGLEPGSLIPSTAEFLDHIVHPEDREQVRQYIASVYAGNRQPSEYRIMRPNGEVRILFSVPEHSFSEDGTIEMIRGITADITERKRDEARLLSLFDRISELNRIYGFGEEIARTGTWTWNITTGSIECSDNLYRLIGLGPQSIKLTPESFSGFVHSEDRALVMRQVADIRQRAHKEMGIEFRLVRTDGKIIYCRSRISLFKDADETIYLGSIADITEEVGLRDSLASRIQFAELLIEASIDRIIVMDQDLKVLAWNRQAEKAYGIKREELLGLGIYEVFPGLRKNKDFTDAVNRALKGQFAGFSNAKGVYSEGYFESFFVPLTDEHGKTQTILNVVRDITDRIATETRLQAQNELLDKANRELAAFTTVTGHDLKEPLRKVYSFLELALTDKGSSWSNEARHFLKRAQSGVQRLNLLTDDILAFASLSEGEAVRSTIRLDNILKYLIHQFAEQIQLSGAVITCEPLPQVPGIHTLISRLFFNLIDNALKFQDGRRLPQISITARVADPGVIRNNRLSEELSYFMISVTDNGIGFDPKHERLIFQLFQRLVRKNEYGGGSGVGLAIASRIAGIHGGALFAESAPGQGSAFHVLLPDGKN